jgi:renalase
MTKEALTPAKRLRVGIVGAGLAGLAAARTLMELGHEAVVFDKGRGPGGRSASRRATPFAFDHGAQYFTAYDPLFRHSLGGWLEQGVAARWDGRLVTLRAGVSRPVRGETERFVGVPQMNALAKHLARDVDLHCHTQVASIEHSAKGWKLRRQDGVDVDPFDRLVLTMPPTQAAALIGEQSPLGERVASISMRPCWAVLLGLAEPYRVPFDGAFCEAAALSWISRDSSKPERPSAEAWVLHASSEWTDEHLDGDPEFIVDTLSGELERLTGVSLPEVLHRDAHCWRFAQPESDLEAGVLIDQERGLILAGDAYCGGRIEGAYLSGVLAARGL